MIISPLCLGFPSISSFFLAFLALFLSLFKIWILVAPGLVPFVSAPVQAQFPSLAEALRAAVDTAQEGKLVRVHVLVFHQILF